MAVGIDCELGCSQQLGDEALIPEWRLGATPCRLK